MEEKTSFSYISIVAIVAIVAIVVLVVSISTPKQKAVTYESGKESIGLPVFNVSNRTLPPGGGTINTTNVTFCSDQCNRSNLSICINSTSFKICGNYDSDPCLEWSQPIYCQYHTACISGFCEYIECSYQYPCEEPVWTQWCANSTTLCVNMTTTQCINPGTPSSYCAYNSTISCGYCANYCDLKTNRCY